MENRFCLVGLGNLVQTVTSFPEKWNGESDVAENYNHNKTILYREIFKVSMSCSKNCKLALHETRERFLSKNSSFALLCVSLGYDSCVVDHPSATDLSVEHAKIIEVPLLQKAKRNGMIVALSFSHRGKVLYNISLLTGIMSSLV